MTKQEQTECVKWLHDTNAYKCEGIRIIKREIVEDEDYDILVYDRHSALGAFGYIEAIPPLYTKIFEIDSQENKIRLVIF